MNKVSSFARLARHWVWIAPVVLGIAFVVGGGYMVVQGRSAHNDVRDTVVQEDITVSADAPAFGGQTIDSPGKAQAQADAILGHTLKSTGGRLYAQLGNYAMPAGTFYLPFGSYIAASGGGTTTDAALAAKDAKGSPIDITQDKALAALDASGNPVPASTSDKTLAAKDASGNPVSNPLRTTALTSAELRTSLGVAVMGFKVADLVLGLGAFLIFLGLMSVFITAPATYWATVTADEHDKNRGKATTTTTGTAGQTA
ncbi:MAG: hypothetical protein ABI559_05485 [Chloroflexota bacterium]